MENKLILFLREKVKNKKVLVLGLGREGRGSLLVLQKAGGFQKLGISDKREITREEVAELWGVDDFPEITFGNSYLDVMEDYDIVLKSPGIVLPKDRFKNTEITSQTEIFLQVYREQVIGITGTKGKSTTTTLIHHILEKAGFHAILLGNIGIPAFDKLNEINEKSLIIFELSCHQLEYLKISPKTAVYLNVFPEHLDHYKTFDAYRLAKENIYKYQKKGDGLYCGSGVIPLALENLSPIAVLDFNRGDKALLEMTNTDRGVLEKERRWQNLTKNGVIVDGYTISYKDRSFTVNEEEIALRGYHNLFDIGVAFAVCFDLGVREDVFRKALVSYRALPHRLEYFGTFDGIKFYDDSISTIPATTIAALETIKDADTVLIGGMDRGIDYAPLIDYLETSKISHIILMEYTGARIEEEIKTGRMELYNSERLILVDNLEEAVQKAKEVTQKGKSCILSPAAASYGIFKNFEERGEVFKSLVKEERV